MFSNNWIAFLITLAISLFWLRLMDYLAQRGVMSVGVSRKIIHIGTGPIFVLCWLLFNSSSSARFFAAVIPLLITLQFTLVGFGILKDEAAVAAMSRSSNPREILKGPLCYGVIFVLITLIFWYKQPAGMVALMILCGGDGLADIVGKRFGKIKLPWSKRKSYAGSAAVLLGGWILSIFVLWVYTLARVVPGTIGQFLFPVAVIAFVATIVESLPLHDIDNITVPIACVAIGLLLL